MGDMEDGAAGVGEGRKENGGWFNWSSFLCNPGVLLQIILYVTLFYKLLPGLDEVGPPLVWLFFLLPMCIMNLIAAHVLKELSDKRKRGKQA